MKVAILSPIAWRTPPEKYGPWEQIASNIAEGLVKKGIDVTVFATADSITSGKLESVCDLPYEIDKENDPKVLECLHISNLMEQASSFDIIHNHFDFLPLTYSKLIKTPMITTIHGFSSPKILPIYKKYNDSSSYISISNSDRSTELDYLRTIYHGIDPKLFTFIEQKEEYLLYFGRIHPDKGAHLAIEIAQKSGFPLKMAGLIQDQHYFDEKIKPFIDDRSIEYLGNVGHALRDSLLGNAKALLHPISFEEPFGLSVAESMMCGTPVIAFNRGSMTELILNGISGYTVATISEAAEAVQTLNAISTSSCRNYTVDKFSLDTMIDAYIDSYETVIGS
jgi:glycosyltransferase involved in cell wall biosynthesis